MMELMCRYQAGGRAELLPEFTAILNPGINRNRLQRLHYACLIPFMTAFADCALAAGRPDMAAKIYDGLAASYPAERFYQPFYRGVAAMLRRDPGTAVRHFRQALAAAPEDETARRNLENAQRLLAPKAARP